MKTCVLFLAVVALLGAVSNAVAATYSLEPVADARVIKYPTFENLNFGTDFLSVYTATSTPNIQRSFFRFDLSSIGLATNELVQSATLTLTASTLFGNNATNHPMQVYRVLLPWTESGVTWSNRDATHAWTNDGGDFAGLNGQPYAVTTTSPTNGETVTWDVTSLVQEWVTNASVNYGLILKSENGNQLTFPSRETGSPATRPHLTVVAGAGLSPIHTYSSGAQVVFWWTQANGVLQEKTNLNSATPWSDSGRTVIHNSGSNAVTISGFRTNTFFRLRNGP